MSYAGTVRFAFVLRHTVNLTRATLACAPFAAIMFLIQRGLLSRGLRAFCSKRGL